jgi:hypothetical protein
MPDQKQKIAPASARQDKPNPALPIALIISAIMFVILGALLPGLAGMTGLEGTVLSVALWVVAAGDVAIAFYLWTKIKKAHQSANSGGTIQRQ